MSTFVSEIVLWIHFDTELRQLNSLIQIDLSKIYRFPKLDFDEFILNGEVGYFREFLFSHSGQLGNSGLDGVTPVGESGQKIFTYQFLFLTPHLLVDRYQFQFFFLQHRVVFYHVLLIQDQRSLVSRNPEQSEIRRFQTFITIQ